MFLLHANGITVNENERIAVAVAPHLSCVDANEDKTLLRQILWWSIH